MIKCGLLVVLLFLASSSIYSQPFFTNNILQVPLSKDFVIGNDDSYPKVPSGKHPIYLEERFDFSPNNFFISTTANDIDHFLVNDINITRFGSNSTHNPDALDAIANIFFKSPTYGINDDTNLPSPNHIFATRGNSTKVVASHTDKDGLVIIEDEAEYASIDNVVLPPLSDFNLGAPDNNFQFRGWGNFNDFPSAIYLKFDTGELVVQQLTGLSPAYNSIFVDQDLRNPFPSNIGSAMTTNSTSTIYNGGYVYYVANDGTNGQELWTSDGTIAGTYMIKDIWPLAGSSFPYDLTPMNNKLYFVAATPAENSELWVSDGTEAGTMMVKSINPAAGHSNIGSMININNMLYFSANGGSPNWTELWKSDGTANGTVMIKNINETPFDVQSIGGFTLFNGLIYFRANDGIHGVELWVTDGTEGGTQLVKNINNTGDGSVGSSLILPGVPNGDVFYFYANDGVHGSELWVSDGTREGTMLAYDLYPGPSSSNSWSGWGINSGGNLFVSADNGVIGHELFIFTNTPTSTPMTSLSLKIFLEGSYLSNSMSTNLTVSIPLRQPFNNPE